MEIYFKEHEKQRYSLHDAIVNDIEIKGDEITFIFNEGIYVVGNDEDKRPAKIVFKKVDYDFSDIIVYKGRNKRRFSGKYISLKALKKMLKKGRIEIVDELYGGYQMTWRGFYYKKNKIREIEISLLYFGLMAYYVETR